MFMQVEEAVECMVDLVVQQFKAMEARVGDRPNFCVSSDTLFALSPYSQIADNLLCSDLSVISR
jgi:hypothetical protein